MRRVQITAGGYGYREKAKSPTKLILAGDFICLPEEEAERLVGIKVAIYADKPEKPTPEGQMPEKPTEKARGRKRKEPAKRDGEGQ